MADFFGDLEQALAQATARRYRSGPVTSGTDHSSARWSGSVPVWLRRLWHQRPLAVVAAALVICGSAAAAVITVASSNSAPLTGAIPRSPGLSTAGLRYDIPVTPDLEPGNAGWCSYPRFWYTGRSHRATEIGEGGTCLPAAAGNRPVILGGGENSLNWTIVSRQVAAVRVGPHQVIRSRSDPRLPFGWRAVVSFSAAFNPTGNPPALKKPLPELIPLDAKGRAIPLGAVPSLAAVSLRSVDPNHPPSGPCALRSVDLPAVTRQWEVVVSHLPHFGSSVAHGALFACAHSWYLFASNAPAVSAAILLNAQDPEQTAPALPDLHPTATAGVFTEDGGSSGNITARRVGRAWLVVQGGTQQARTDLLESLARTAEIQ